MHYRLIEEKLGEFATFKGESLCAKIMPANYVVKRTIIDY